MDADVFRQRTGISYRQLDTWTKAGLLQTTGPSDPGAGFRRSWPEPEVAVASGLLTLTRAGIKLDVAASVARQGEGEYKLADGVFLHFTP